MPLKDKPQLHEPQKLTDILYNTLNQAQADNINLQSLIDALDSRAFGVILILLTIPNLIPGISSISAGIIFYYSIQMFLGRPKPRLPVQVKEFTIDSNFRSILKIIIGYTSKFEHYIKPRWLIISDDIALKLIGIVLMLFSFVIFIPIPFSNLIPSLAILLIAFGLLQKDGAVVIVSSSLGIIYCVGFIWLVSKAVFSIVF